MIVKPMDVLEKYEIRKTRKQKTAFIDAVNAFANGKGYSCYVEKGSMGSRNIVIGDPAKAKYLVTAHYDTPAGMFFPNLITPCNIVTYIAYQICLVMLFLAAAFLAGFAVSFLTSDESTIFLAGYAVYFGLLFLMMFGPANRHTANDNTSGVVSVLEIAATLPENLRHQVCFVLFDLEEAGLIGSSSYRKTHKASTEGQIVLNMDCVGDGDHLIFFPGKKVKKDPAVMDRLRGLCGQFGKKSIRLHERGFAHYPSDQRNFPLGIGIAAFRKKKGVGYYCSRIHTWRDTILEQTNVNVLRAAVISFIGSDLK